MAEEEGGIESTEPSDTPPFTDDNPEVGIEEIPEATVVIGQVNLDSDNDALFGNIDTDSFFTDYMINNRYEKDPHKYMLPISSPDGFQGASVAFVQIASPTLLWVSDWTAAKLGSQPEIPNPDNPPQIDDWVLLDEVYEPAMVTMNSDGITPLYRISGTFIYGHKNPQDVTILNVAFPRPPWLLDQLPLGRGVPGSMLTDNLITSPDTINSGGG